MSRKDYIVIARAINETRQNGGDLEALIPVLGTELKADNPNFNRSRFTEACGFQVE